MLLLGTKGIRVIMSYTPQGYDSFGLPAEQYAIQTGSTLQRRPKQTSIAIENSSIDWGFLLTGVGSFAPQTLPIIAGHSGFLCSFLMLGMIPKQIKLDPIDELINHLAAHGTKNLSAHCDEDTNFNSR
ncbi:MAG: hypothetical protein CM15mP59_1180 [Flavobacteriaceae bacterium]|nr:MAG: hypothetical protein CM15mP59_1180 [Flavobacteriaceae bacterium]